MHPLRDLRWNRRVSLDSALFSIFCLKLNKLSLVDFRVLLASKELDQALLWSIPAGAKYVQKEPRKASGSKNARGPGGGYSILD